MEQAIEGGNRQRRLDPWLLLALASLAGAFVILLYLGRRLTFYWDEWVFIQFAGMGTPLDWFTPHNEHWSTLPFLLYRATFSLVGLNSYLPYLAELLVVHLVAVAAVVALARRDLGPVAGFVAALPLLLLGSGHQNLLWAFQTGFIGSVAAGAWALYALDTPGRRWALAGAILLLTALLCSGVGLFWVGAAGLELALDARRRSRLAAVVPAVVAYVAWYALLGSTAITQHRSPFSIQALIDTPLFVARGVVGATAQFSGLGRLAGALAFGALALGTLIGLVRRTAPPRAVAMLGGIVLMYGAIGLVRAGLSDDYAAQSRYTYIAAFFLVLGITSWLGQLAREGNLPRAARLALLGLVAVSVVAGVIDLREARGRQQARAATVRAFVAAAVANEGAPWVDPDIDWHFVPPPRVIPDLVREHGDPNRDTLVPSVVPPPRAGARDQAVAMLMGRNFRAVPGVEPVAPVPPEITRVQDATITADGACLAARVTGPQGAVTIVVPAGGAVTLTPATGGEAAASIGRGRPLARTRIPVPLTAGETTAVQVPDTGDGPWLVQVGLPTGPVRLCIAPQGG